MITGLEFSDTTLRFISLKRERGQWLPHAYEELPLPVACIQGGVVTDRARLAAFLRTLKKNYSFKEVRITLPASVIQVGSVAVDSIPGGASFENIKAVIKKNKNMEGDIVVDRNFIAHTKKGRVAHYTAAQTSVVEGYLKSFASAKIIVRAVLHPLQALSLSVVENQEKDSVVLVNRESRSTSLALVVRGVVIDTVSLDHGALFLNAAVEKGLHLNEGQARSLVQQKGFLSKDDMPQLFEILAMEGQQLAREIVQQVVGWGTSKHLEGVASPVEHIILSGEDVFIPGFADFLHSAVKLPVLIANPWTHCFSFDVLIPDILAPKAQSYAAAIGLALPGSMIGVLPHKYKKRLKRKKIWRNTRVLFVSFLFGAALGFGAAYALYYFDVRWATDSIVQLLHKI